MAMTSRAQNKRNSQVLLLLQGLDECLIIIMQQTLFNTPLFFAYFFWSCSRFPADAAEVVASTNTHRFILFVSCVQLSLFSVQLLLVVSVIISSHGESSELSHFIHEGSIHIASGSSSISRRTNISFCLPKGSASYVNVYDLPMHSTADSTANYWPMAISFQQRKCSLQ